MDSDEPPRFLCLLPPAPTPPTLASLKEAFGDTIRQVLKEVATQSSESTRAAVLEIALACPHLVGSRNHKARSLLYQSTQSLLAGVYGLVGVIAAQEDVNVEDADGVDVRILILAWSPDGPSEPPAPTPYGCVVDILTLACSGRAWQYAFGVESEAGEKMVAAFVEAKNHAESLESARSGSSRSDTDAGQQRQEGNSLHYDVAVGGTFDHLHIGHKLLITMTIFAVDEDSSSNKERSAIIGITGDQLLVNKKYGNFVESWADRQKAVATFFNAILDFSLPASSGQRHVGIRDDPGPNGKSVDVHYPNGLIVKCTEIQDPFGPTITEEHISALIISAETRSGGKAVNDKRKAQGWKELDVFEVDVLEADDGSDEGGRAKKSFDSKISSTAIREKLARKSGGKI